MTATRLKEKKVFNMPLKRAYRDYIFDLDGWCDAEKFKPLEYELVLLKDSKDKIQKGWWTGFIYDFGNQRIGNPIYWKQTKYDPIGGGECP